MKQPIRILLIDDEATFWKPMSQQLVQAGLRVDVATSGRQALAMARACDGAYQVAVIDQVMGPPNGTEIMINLRQLYSGIESILLTGWGDMGPGENAMELGAYSYLSKPVKANELALNIRCAARFGQERQRSLSLQQLVSAGQKIGGAQTENQLYQQIYTEVKELLPSLDGFLVSQYDESQDLVKFPFCYCRGKLIKLPPRKQGNSLTNYVLRTQEPLLLPNGDKEFRKTHNLNPPDQRLGYKKSLIVAPMFLNRRVIGTLSALTYKDNTRFTLENLQMFQAFSNQAAAAISNVQQLVEAKQLKDAVSVLTGKRERIEVIRAIVEEAHKLIACDFTGLILRDEDGTLHKVKPVIPASQYNQFEEPRQQDGVTRAVVESRHPMVIRDTYKEKLVKDSVRGKSIHSMLAFPLCYGDKVLGVLYGHHYSTLFFSDHDVELWAAFTTQAAVALSNALEDERWTKDFKRLEQVTTALKRKGNLRVTMREVATAAKNVFESDTCRLALVEPTTFKISDWMWAKNIPEKYRIETPPRPNGITNYVLRTKKPVFHSIDDPNEPQPIPELAKQGLKYTLSLPLIISSRITGVIHCNYLDRREPDYDRLQYLVPAFCTRAAIALDRARQDQLSETWHELEQRVVVCNDLKDLYKVFVEHAHSAFQADLSIFYPFDPTYPEENPKPIWDDIVVKGKREKPWQRAMGGQGGGVISALMKSKDGLLIVNRLNDLNGKYASQLAAREDVKAFVAVCLQVTLPGSDSPKLAGILFLNYRTPTAFEQQDLVALRSASASIAQAILGLHLQTALKQAFEERKSILQAGTEILHAFEREGKELDPEIIARKVVEVLGIGACTIMEYDRKAERFLRRGIAGVYFPDKHYTIPKEFKTRFMDVTSYTLITDVQEDVLFRLGSYSQREDIKSSVIFPLWVDGEALGLLFADNRSSVALSLEKIEALGLFADFAALVLHESQLNARLDATQQKLSRRIFLDWVSMIEASWRHSLVQRAASILNLTAFLKSRLASISNHPVAMENVPSTIDMIDRLAREIADAPPRVPQSLEVDPDLFPLAPLLQEVVKREYTPTGTNPLIQVDFRIDALGGAVVRGYRRWLIYALEALLKNARRAMPRGGTVTIMGQQTADWIDLRIQDTGSGIPKPIQERLFKELIPPKDDKQGMGIGSLLVATIIEMHDGEVSLERPGPGDTTILIRLPCIKTR